MKKTITKEQANKSTLIAVQYSYDGGIVWEFFDIHIEVKGQPRVVSVKEGKSIKQTAMMRLAIVPIPPEGLQCESLYIFNQEDLGEVKNNPDLLWLLLDSLDWGEPFYHDDLNWSDGYYSQV